MTRSVTRTTSRKVKIHKVTLKVGKGIRLGIPDQGRPNVSAPLKLY